ncbi:MAG: hypothetical protein KBG25_02905 [Paludibacteraceae bacterium]|nr:hypothetical protein [Paludibacteraceae bacterium]
MMKIKIYILVILVLATGSCNSNKTAIEPEDLGYEAPVPPVTVNQSNVFTIEFYSLLNNEPLFKNYDYKSVVDHITGNKIALAYLFDRSDIELGETPSIVDIAWKSKMNSFFIQNNVDEKEIEGTGMIVRPLVNVFEGIAIVDSFYIGGCTLLAPLSQPVSIILMTCKITQNFQFSMIAKYIGELFPTNKVIVGTLKNDMEEEMKTYLKYHLKNFRLSFYSPEKQQNTYKIFFLTPVNFVCREVTRTMIENIPMYECKIEYLN